MLKKAISFLSEDVWRIQQNELSKSRSTALKATRIILSSLKGFNEDKCAIVASALTFFTLLSIVPLFATIFGIAQGFGLEELLEQQVAAQMQGQDEVVAYIIDFSKKMLENTSGGLIAGIGVGILFFTVIRLIGNIEASLNGIWGVKEHRSWVRKFSDYLALMVVCPVLMIVASSLNVYIVEEVKQLTMSVEWIGLLKPLILFVLKFSPFVVLWLLFSFIYIVIPNTRVKLVAGIVGGIVSGAIFQIFQLLYINVMQGMMGNSAVYGSFAALPLFLFWLQISWQIMLFGAEVAFSFQNVDTYELEPDCHKASNMFRRLAALRVSNIVVREFIDGNGPVLESHILEKIEIPFRLSKDLLYKLVSAQVLVELPNRDSKEPSYMPAKDPHTLTVGNIIKLLEMDGMTDVPIQESAEILKLRDALSAFQQKLNEDPLNFEIGRI